MAYVWRKLLAESCSIYVGDVTASNGRFSGSVAASFFHGTSSWAISASWAPGGGTSLGTGSTYPITSSWAESASWANSSSYSLTASYASNAGITIPGNDREILINSGSELGAAPDFKINTQSAFQYKPVSSSLAPVPVLGGTYYDYNPVSKEAWLMICVEEDSLYYTSSAVTTTTTTTTTSTTSTTTPPPEPEYPNALSSSVYMWLSADQGITLSSGVAEWRSHDGENITASMSNSSLRPSYETSLGPSTVYFDGFTGQYLQIGNTFNLTGSLISAGSGSLIAVLYFTNTSHNGGFHSLSGDSNNNHHPYEGSAYEGFGTTTRRDFGLGLTNQFFVYFIRARNGSWNARLNGTSSLLTGTNTFGMGESKGQTIGTSDVYYAQIHVAEFAIFKDYLDNTATANAENYLRNKYGTS